MQAVDQAKSEGTQRARKKTRLTAIANGMRREQPPLGFTKIIVEYKVQSSDTAAADIEKAIQLAEEAYCPVWQMVKNNVEIIAEYRLVAS